MDQPVTKDAPRPGQNVQALVAELLKADGRVIESTIVGSSMGDTLPPGARIRIQCHHGTTTRVGDIAVGVLPDGTLVAHRVVARIDRGTVYLVMRGDAHVLCDVPIADTKVLGTVTSYESAGDWHAVGAPERAPVWRRAGAAVTLGVTVFLLRAHPGLAGRTINLLKRLAGRWSRH